MHKSIANFFSIVLHPVFIPFIITGILLNTPTHLSLLSFQNQRVIYVFIFAITILLPIAAIPFSIALKASNNWHLEERTERILPLLFSGAAYISGSYILSKTGFPEIYTKAFIDLLIGGAISGFVLAAISSKWKISIHATGIGGGIGFLVAFSHTMAINLLYIISVSCLLAGILGTSRLILKSHTPSQVFAGYIIGFAILFGITIIRA